MAPDTIVALSTPPGRSGVAVVRVSGAAADQVLAAVAPALEIGRAPPREARLSAIHDPSTGDLVDRALVTRFPGPASYTGEDVVEISCHGGWLVPALVVEACVVAGARQAERGEFSRRAYLNGKLDLVQVEAVADLIDARSRALHRASLIQLDRGLSERIAALRERLIRTEALLAHHLDFPEEDDAPVPLTEVVSEADDVLAKIDGLLRTAPEGALLREGAVVVLAGAPNAGKSSLYNALVGEDRAMVTEVPGTTRDALESTVELGGFPFRLVDTAGLRDSEERLEMMGIEVARRALARADLVLYCTEKMAVGAEFDRLRSEINVPMVIVHTKRDLRGAGAPGVWAEEVAGYVDVAGYVEVSTVTGHGLGDLQDRLPRAVFSGLIETGGEVPVVTRRRQVRALEAAREAVEMFRRELEGGVPADLAATHLRPAESALEELLGVVSVDDVLDVLFADFCIGK